MDINVTSPITIDVTQQMLIPLLSLATGLIGALIGAGAIYFVARYRENQEIQKARTDEIKTIYRHVAFLLLKKYKNAKTENLDDAFLQSLVDINLCDDKHDPINESIIVLTNNSWNNTTKHTLIENKILPEMRARLKELSQEEKHWWQFWK